ncbi:hypothetical protein ACN42_g1547 [Penicillium freii]|uniref:Uncharacterized protein n=1 Tax=Penicillium freii TaxID=48697 RepID=A0A101MRV6_PENFR|nr:hypothetical protein ACN42_g1547 [Penicillium freii]
MIQVRVNDLQHTKQFVVAISDYLRIDLPSSVSQCARITYQLRITSTFCLNPCLLANLVHFNYHVGFKTPVPAKTVDTSSNSSSVKLQKSCISARSSQ